MVLLLCHLLIVDRSLCRTKLEVNGFIGKCTQADMFADTLGSFRSKVMSYIVSV